MLGLTNSGLILAFIFATATTLRDFTSGAVLLAVVCAAALITFGSKPRQITAVRAFAALLAGYTGLACLGWVPGPSPFGSAVAEFITLAIAFEGRNSQPTTRASRQVMFLFAALILLSLMWINFLYGGELKESALSTASMTAVVVALLARKPLQWPVSVLSSSYPSQRLASVLLFTTTFVPIALGCFLLFSIERELVDFRTAVSAFVFFLVILCAFVGLLGASWSQRINRARELAVKRLEDSWKNRESYFRNLVDNSPVILYLSGTDGSCTFLSRKWQDYTGRSVVSDLGFGWLDCVHPEDRTRMEERTRLSTGKVEPYSSEFRLRRWDGKYRWVFSTGFPRFDDERRFIGYMGNVIDVHERKIQEDSLKKQKRDAELSSQTKSQFLANMSHEIRTPLNAILGFADLCSDGDCDQADRLNYLKRIRWNGDHLLRLIDDILDLAKMESGAKLVQRSRFSIGKALDEIIDSLRALASQKGLFIKVVKANDLPSFVQSDPHRIKQIVNNLVGNAIKFTVGGGITVTMQRCDQSVAIDVSDTGVGIAPEQVANLFKPFSQGDSSVTRKFGGTGLGLHLSRKLAQSIGGDIVLKSSVPGEGSVFRFTFDIGAETTEPALVPEKARSVSEAAAVPTVKFFGRKILVAEDSPDSRDLIEIYLRPTGAQVLFADNGYEAVEVAWKQRPDLILMDVQMPGLDGLEATRRLRCDGFKNPIVALTAHALQDEVDRSFEAGCTFHLTKPVSKVTLLTLLAELLQPVVQNQTQV